jgi:cell division septal protein FtsQ
MKNHWFRLGIGLAVAGVVVFGLFLLLKGSSIFVVKKVEVVGLTGDRALRVRNASLGQSTIDFDEEAVRAAVTGKEPIRSFAVDTHPLHGVTVTVVLYMPVAAAGLNASAAQAVAADGTVLPGVSATGLPLVQTSVAGGYVRGKVVLESLRVLAAAPPQFRRRVKAFAKDRKFGLFATMDNGTKIYFGDSSLPARKWAAASTVLADPKVAGATYVDVRVPRRPVVGGVQGGVIGGVDPADPNQPVGGDNVDTQTDSTGGNGDNGGDVSPQ